MSENNSNNPIYLLCGLALGAVITIFSKSIDALLKQDRLDESTPKNFVYPESEEENESED